MRAITCTGYGAPTEVLHPVDIDPPAITDDQVLVRVEAAALNPADWHLVRGTPYLARLQVGLRRPDFEVPGSDVAGVVLRVGPAVTTLRPGDRVVGTTFMAGFGAFAECVAVPERLLARRDDTVPAEEWAGLPLAASTALQALRDHGRVEAGQRVLIIGASGGVGTYAVQLAGHLGASVTAVCSGRNVDLVRRLGADQVIDYTTEEITRPADGYDLVLQVAGTAAARHLRRLLTPGGVLVQLSGDSPNRWTGPLARIVAGRLANLGRGPKVVAFTVHPCREDLELLAGLVRDGALRTSVDHAVGLDDVAGALEQLEGGRTRGKIVVTMPSPPPPAAVAAEPDASGIA